MPKVVVLGVFVADTAYRAQRQPRLGETVLGEGFALGPGGKGSNQAVAAARAGGEVSILTRLGVDAFADLALATWAEAGVTPEVERSPESYTGAAYIFLEAGTGQNAIIVAPGAAGLISEGDVDARADLIRGADVFVTQLEQPLPAAIRALQVAREAGVVTVLNPAPAAALPPGTLALCDWVTPNESEAEALSGVAVTDPVTAHAAARALRRMGAGSVVVTLGAQGALLLHGDVATHVPAIVAGPVADTTGAGDAFNGGLAVALAEGRAALDAVRFGVATAAISVTRPGTAPAMPSRVEIDALLAREAQSHQPIFSATS
jgi:ribokinase